MENDKTRYCAVCGKDMMDPETGARNIGIEISVKSTHDSWTEGFKKQLGRYAVLWDSEGLYVAICWECRLRLLGVPALQPVSGT